jgi:hypothetical protein
MQSRAPDSELPGRPRGRQTSLHQCKSRTDLFFFKSRASGPEPHHCRCLKTVTGTFTDEPALKVRDGAENVEDQFPCRRTRINALFKGNEGDAQLFQLFDGLQQFPERAPETVGTHHTERIARAGIFKQGGQSLMASAAGFEECVRHMNIEEHLQVQVKNSDLSNDNRDNLIATREDQRDMAGLGMLAGVGFLFSVGAISGRKTSPKLNPPGP